MDLAQNGWIAKSRGGSKPKGNKGGGKKNAVPANKSKMLLGSEMKNKTKNPGALK